MMKNFNLGDYIIYLHISPSNKYYVGLTKQSIQRRWRKGNGYKSCIAFDRAINKYGWDNFQHTILYTGLDKLNADIIELDLIYYYKSKNISYNITDGGEGVQGVNKGGHLSEEHKAKIGLGNKGKHMSEEAKTLISEANKGHTAWNKGLHRTKEQNEHLSKVNPNKKPVILIDKNTNEIINNFYCINAASRATNIADVCIIRCCKGRQKTAGGFIWKYKE